MADLGGVQVEQVDHAHHADYLLAFRNGKLEDVEYEIVGKIEVDKGVVRKIPFNHRGTVDFTRATKAR